MYVATSLFSLRHPQCSQGWDKFIHTMKPYDGSCMHHNSNITDQNKHIHAPDLPSIISQGRPKHWMKTVEGQRFRGCVSQWRCPTPRSKAHATHSHSHNTACINTPSHTHNHIRSIQKNNQWEGDAGHDHLRKHPWINKWGPDFGFNTWICENATFGSEYATKNEYNNAQSVQHSQTKCWILI